MALNTSSRIKLLTADIASKIAAGEVVERPASVLKELMENSIDAGATQVDVSIDRGGIQLIKVRDNGVGILQQDLALALQQHATSKISSVNDLANIASLGFRGEALASINSVARLNITSHTQQQEHAWSISLEQINAAAHPIGTTVQVCDLFYNIPARRKFLRSERTEYQYLEEVFRRIALSNFDVGFSLTNHGKLIKSLPQCGDLASRTKRLINLCGQQVLKQTITIDAEQNGLHLWGWLGAAQQARSQEPHQYFFINKRVIKDRLINHAIRQVYQPLCAAGKMPFYCLYLELDTAALDVNVHPTKHEVRFRDQRVIHAFLTQIINAALGEATSPQQPIFQPALLESNIDTSVKNSINNLQIEPFTVLDNKILITKHQNQLAIIDVLAMRKYLLLQHLKQEQGCIALDKPQTVIISQPVIFDDQFATWCQTFGFTFELIGAQKILLRAVPLKLQCLTLKLELLLQEMYQLWHKQAAAFEIYQMIVTCVDFDAPLPHTIAQELVEQFEHVPGKGIWRMFNIQELQSLC